MNKILKLSAIALLASSTSLMAQSKNFAGASLGISLSAIGAEISGSSTSSSGGDLGSNSTSGSIGKVAEIAAIDASYGFGMGANSVFVVGATYTPGKAKAGSGNYTERNNFNGNTGGNDTGTLNVEIKDPYTIYVAPTYVVGNNAALYAKLGYSKTDVSVNATGGAALTQKPSDLEGWTYGIGSKTLLTNNVYVGVEASITDYDTISATRSGSVKTSADVKVAQGTITLGYKF
jgi:opacity protein-like surface antigen